MLYFPRVTIKDLERCLNDAGGSDLGHVTDLSSITVARCMCPSHWWLLSDISMPDIQVGLTSPSLNGMLRK